MRKGQILFAAVPGVTSKPSALQAGLWGVDTEGGQQSLHLTQLLLADPGFLSTCVCISHLRFRAATNTLEKASHSLLTRSLTGLMVRGREHTV